MLSRIAVSAVSLGIDFRKMATEKQTDDEVKAQRTVITSLRLEDVPIDDSIPILYDISTGRVCPIVPSSMRCLVFDVVHGLSPPGARTTRKLITDKFVWHPVNKDVSTWVKRCLSCQKAKVQTHAWALTAVFEPKSRRFDHVHIDVICPLSISQRFKYLLTIVDRYTLWPEAIPLKETTTTAVARALVHAMVGLPSSEPCPHEISNSFQSESNKDDRVEQPSLCNLNHFDSKKKQLLLRPIVVLSVSGIRAIFNIKLYRYVNTTDNSSST